MERDNEHFRGRLNSEEDEEDEGEDEGEEMALPWRPREAEVASIGIKPF